jgi:hypothetical protein
MARKFTRGNETCDTQGVTFPKGDTMKLARYLLLAASFAGVAGSAAAQEAQGTWSDPGYSADASRVYEVDVDRDGKADYLLKLEQSDTLA